MLSVTINNRTYHVGFHYDDKEDKLVIEDDKNPHLIPIKETTVCTISEKIGDKLYRAIAVGVAFCSAKDSKNHNKARKLSMTRALNFLPFNKDERKVFWDQYFTTRNGKKD